MEKIPVVTVLGPTASGKTALSVKLAKHFDAEIVSADSMQIYKNMDIATASPSMQEREGIVHHMMNFLDPGETYSVADYVSQAHRVIADIHSRNKMVILCGGTGLYIDSLLNNITFTEIDKDERLRKELYDLAEEKGTDYLLDMIRDFDEPSFDRLSKEKNLKRIVRCIEIYKTTGVTQTQQIVNSKLTPSPYIPVKIGLKTEDRQYLYDRINRRVDIMLEMGLVKEAETFFSSKKGGTSSMAIGYKELKPYFTGEKSLDECVEDLKMQTRRYAKRQLTWFLKDKNIRWYEIDVLSFNDILDHSIEYVEEFING